MILNGKSGQILALSPLIPCLTMDHPIESSGLVAMCLAHLVRYARPSMVVVDRWLLGGLHVSWWDPNRR